MSKHTPGPWKVFICDDGGEWSGWPLAIYQKVDDVSEDGKCVVRPGGFYPYTWDPSISQIEALDNAELIARAPDLLREVEELRAAIGLVPLSVRDGGRNMTPEDWDNLDNAVPRLLGENESLRAQNVELLDLLKEAHTGLTHGGGMCAACGAEPGCDIDCPVCRWTAKVDAAIAKAEGGAA